MYGAGAVYGAGAILGASVIAGFPAQAERHGCRAQAPVGGVEVFGVHPDALRRPEGKNRVRERAEGIDIRNAVFIFHFHSLCFRLRSLKLSTLLYKRNPVL